MFTATAPAGFDHRRHVSRDRRRLQHRINELRRRDRAGPKGDLRQGHRQSMTASNNLDGHRELARDGRDADRAHSRRDPDRSEQPALLRRRRDAAQCPAGRAIPGVDAGPERRGRAHPHTDRTSQHREYDAGAGVGKEAQPAEIARVVAAVSGTWRNPTGGSCEAAYFKSGVRGKSPRDEEALARHGRRIPERRSPDSSSSSARAKDSSSTATTGRSSCSRTSRATS